MNTGIPDFQTSSQAAGSLLYPAYLRPGRWLVLPHALEIQKREDGSPDFQIDLVRSAEAGLAAYGIVDFRVGPVVALEAARKALPEAGIEAADFSGGWLRLQVREPSKPESSTILPPRRIASNGLGGVRLASRMTPEGISLLKRALLEGTVMVEAWAEMTIEGVAPKFPATVILGPADVERLRGVTSNEGVARRNEVVKALTQCAGLAGLPANIGRTEAAEAIADRLFSLVGELVPSPEKDFAECWRLKFESGGTRLEWDLSQAANARRLMVLRFDPVAFLREAAAGGVERLVIQRELPDFKTGYVPLLVTANLPDVRSPALSCGVDIEAKAKPPHRLDVIRETVEFEPPRDRREIILRFAADEEPEYQIQTFVFAQTDKGMEEWRSAKQGHLGEEVRLGPEDFAACFVPVEASAQLLAEGDLAVTAQWGGISETVHLSQAKPSDTLVYDAAAERVEISCLLNHAGGSVGTPIPGAKLISLDLDSFREYGAHQVDIEMDFSDGPELIALKLKPESEADAAATTLSFTRSKPRRGWAWFAKSPFAPGYRYRCFQTDHPASWSEPQSPFEPLRLKASELLPASTQPIAEGQ